MALTLNERKIIRLMIRDGSTDDSIDAISADDDLARTAIADFKAVKLSETNLEIERLDRDANNVSAYLTKLNSLKNVLEA